MKFEPMVAVEIRQDTSAVPVATRHGCTPCCDKRPKESQAEAPQSESKICGPWLVRGRELLHRLPAAAAAASAAAPRLTNAPRAQLLPTPHHHHHHHPHAPERAGQQPPLPPPRRRRGRRHGDEAERDLGGVLLGVVEVLAVVPEPGLVDRAVDGHAARPGCATTYLFQFRGQHIW